MLTKESLTYYITNFSLNKEQEDRHESRIINQVFEKPPP